MSADLLEILGAEVAERQRRIERLAADGSVELLEAERARDGGLEQRIRLVQAGIRSDLERLYQSQFLLKVIEGSQADGGPAE